MPLPELFTTRIQSAFPKNAESILQNLHRSKPTTIRVNTLRTNADSVTQTLSAQGITITPVEWYQDALIIPAEQRDQLMQTDLYRAGHIYIQSLSSMLPPLLLDPQPGEEILDLAAAPGSKTSQMACMMQNNGRIAAVEVVKSRFFKLRSNLQQQGVTCVDTYLKDGGLVWRHCKDRFDRVLLDAPCSSEGRFDPNIPDSFHYWSERKIKEMSRKQWKLLYSAFQCVKPDGVLIYSTCTFAPEENEAILNKLIKKFDDQVIIENIDLPIANTAEGITEWQDKQFSPDISKSIHILPDATMDGFFICKIRKRHF